MKKITAIVLALVIALSVAVTSFAASTYQCPYCFEIIEGEEKYNEHLEEKCSKVGSEAAEEAEKEATLEKQTCPYEGCGAQFLDEAQYEAHLDVCLMKTDPSLAEQVEDFIINFSIFGAIDTVFGLLEKVDFPSILVTIIDLLEKAVTGIIGAI